MKRLVVFLIIALVVGGLAALTGWVTSGGNLGITFIVGGVSGVITFLIGVIYSFYESIKQWSRAMKATTQLLVKQQRMPEQFIKPSISWHDLYPHKTEDDTDYIRIWLEWDNRTFMKVSISNIKGSLSIEGSYPECDLPANIKDVQCEALAPYQDHVDVRLSSTALRTVKEIRDKGYGTVKIELNVSASIRLEVDREHRTYNFPSVSYRAYYLDERTIQERMKGMTENVP